MPVYSCAHCPFSSRHYDKMLKHFFIDPRLTIRCGIEICLKSHSRVNSLESDINRKHTDLHEKLFNSGSHCGNVDEPPIAEGLHIINNL